MSSLEDVVESGILIIQALSVTLTLKTVNQFFCMTLWLTMLHKHIKFGHKKLCASEDIITDILNLHCDHHPERSNLIFPQDIQLLMLYYKTQFVCKWTSSL